MMMNYFICQVLIPLPVVAMDCIAGIRFCKY
jgi:hypothetical protein